MEHDFTVIPIKRNDDAAFPSCPLDDGFVRGSWRILRNGKNILARIAQCIDGRQRNVLVGEQSHDMAGPANRWTVSSLAHSAANAKSACSASRDTCG